MLIYEELFLGLFREINCAMLTHTHIFVCLYFSPDLNAKVAPMLEPYLDIFGRSPIRFVVGTKKRQGRTNRSLTFDIINI